MRHITFVVIVAICSGCPERGPEAPSPGCGQLRMELDTWSQDVESLRVALEGDQLLTLILMNQAPELLSARIDDLDMRRVEIVSGWKAANATCKTLILRDIEKNRNNLYPPGWTPAALDQPEDFGHRVE